jgi:hypothetical protein
LIIGEITFGKVRLEVDIKNVAAQTLDRVVERQNVDALVYYIQAWMDVNEIPQFNAQVVTSDFVQLDPVFVDVIRALADQDCIASSLPT